MTLKIVPISDRAKWAYPAGQECSVQSGFWKIYQGCSTQTFEGVQQDLHKYNVQELVSVDRRMGEGVLVYLFVRSLC